MAKRSRAQAVETPIVESPPSGTVKLRLKQNDFVHGEFAKAGTVFEFSEAEAKDRITKEAKWTFV